MKGMGHEREVDSGTGRSRGSAGSFHLERVCWELRSYPKYSQHKQPSAVGGDGAVPALR